MEVDGGHVGRTGGGGAWTRQRKLAVPHEAPAHNISLFFWVFSAEFLFPRSDRLQRCVRLFLDLS